MPGLCQNPIMRGEPTRASVRLNAILDAQGKGSAAFLAQKLDVTEVTVSRWRHGLHKPNAGQRLELWELHGIPWRDWEITE